MSENKQNTAIVVPHSHWDREWYLPFEAFRMRLVELVDTLCDILESDPDFSFHMDGQTIVVDDYEEIRGRSDKLRKFIREGRVTTGPWYVQPDEFLPSGESLIRNLQTGIKSARKTGSPSMIGYFPDMFGHIGQMPQILRGFGIKRALLWRGVPPEIDKCGFIWRSPDGSEVFTGFLPMGYSNGFNLPLDPEDLKARIIITRAVMGRFIEGPSWLLMAGTDHQQPRGGLAAALKKAFDGVDDWDVRFGSLDDYFDRLEKESVAKPVATGELRDPHYAPILPATASTRMYLKRRDFKVTGLMERYAEPLAAWVWAMGGKDRRDFLDHAWKLLLQNHPHDSICGCSVDEVHREMLVRYDRVETVVQRVLDEASSELGSMMGLPALKWFALWTPAGTDLPVPVTMEIDGRVSKTSTMIAPDGGRLPLQVVEEIEPGFTIANVDVPAFAAPLALAMLLQDEESMGGYLVDINSKHEENVLKLTLGIGKSPAGLDIEEAQKRIKTELAENNPSTLKIELRREPRVKAVAVCENPPQYSIEAFHISRSRDEHRSNLKTRELVIESLYWRVVADDDGTLTIHDRLHDIVYKNALKYVDEGDRGDEYNFEPFWGDEPIDEPESVQTRMVQSGPVAATLRIEARYKIPLSLGRDGVNRSKRSTSMKITTDVTVYNDVRWIEFRAVIENQADDHRVRVLFQAPFTVDEILCESTFEVTRRKTCVAPEGRTADPADIMSLLIGPEARVGYGPHRGFAAIENDGAGMSVFNRGLPEIEAVEGEEGTAIALTLLRCVGTISRDDMKLRVGHAGPPIATPEAQCRGVHTCEFAFTSYKGSWREAGIPAMAHAYRHPPYAFRISPGKDLVQHGDSPIHIDNPAVQIRAMQPAPDGKKALCVRIYNTTDEPQKARAVIADCFCKYAEADLMGKTIKDKHIEREGSHGAVLNLAPAGIITIRLEIT